ncbi:MAG: cation transporter [Planctomycetes bacterium]|nr:cation transporter [Planctomycetota bacterium]
MLELQVTGMKCSQCAASVKTALLECPGVGTVEVDLTSGQADVSGRDLDGDLLCRTVAALGYGARVNLQTNSDGGRPTV